MLSIPIKLDVSAEKAEQALRRFYAGVENALDGIVDLNGTVINFDVNFRKTGDDVVKALSDTDAAQKKAEKSARKLDQGQENSIKRIKHRVTELKKERDALAINSKMFKLKSAEIKKHEARLLSLQGVQRGSIAALKAKRAELIQVRNNLKLNSTEYNRLTAEIDKFDETLKGNNAQLDKSKKKTLGFVNVFAKIAIVSAGIQSISAALRSVGNAIDVYTRRTKDVEAFNLAIQNVGFSQSETTRIFKQAEITANSLGAPLQQVEKSYRRMIPALKAVGTSAADSDKFIEAISARSQTLGLNTEQSGRLLEAFAQVLSKGKLQAEELNQQISELDGAFRTQLADALEVTTEELTEMISNSQVTADVFIEAVNKMENGAEALRARVAEGNLTIQQFQNIISNIDTKNIENIGKAIEPAIKSFLAIRLAVADFIKEFVDSPQFFFLKNTFNDIAKGVEVFAKSLLSTLSLIGKLTSVIQQAVNFVLDLDAGVGSLVTILTNFALVLGTVNAALILATKTKVIFAAMLKKVGANAFFASLGLKATLMTALKITGPLMLVMGGINLVSEAFKRGAKRGAAFDAQLDLVEESMKKIAEFSPPARNGLLLFIENVLGGLSKMGDPETTGAFGNIQSQINRVARVSEATSAKIKNLGINFSDLGSFTSASSKDLKEFRSQLLQQDKANKIGLATAERRLKNLKEQDPQNQLLIDQLKKQIKQLKSEISTNEKRIPILEKILLLRGEDFKATEKQTDALKKLKEATEEGVSEDSLAAIKARTQAIKELGTETELLAAANLGIQQAESESNLKRYEVELNKIKENALANKTFTDEEKERVKQLTLLIAQEREKQAQLGLDAQNLINDALEQGIEKAQRLGDVSGNVASNLMGAFDGLAGSLTQGLGAATSLMNQLVADEIKGLEVGSRMRQEIVLKQLKGQARANEIEHQIAKTKLRVQNMIAVSEAKIAGLRLRAEAEVARARGQDNLANALEDAANMQNLVVAGLRQQFKVSNAVLDIEKRKKDQALIRKGLDEKITNNQSKMGRILGVQKTTFKDSLKILDNMADESDDLLDAFADSAENAQQMKEDANRVAIKQGAASADKIAKAFDKGAEAAKRMKDELSDVKRLSDQISRIIGSSTGNPARAMGGPVQGGSSYFVNDGGGREGFLSNSGNFSMLPAARNINWTAPTSGTIIPAGLVDRYQQALAANQSVTSRTSIQPASKGVDRVSATIDSGSLVQRMAAVMSGNGGDQRITNHVTIQSQEPVTDASKIMTNVARMKLRKGGRF